MSELKKKKTVKKNSNPPKTNGQMVKTNGQKQAGWRAPQGRRKFLLLIYTSVPFWFLFYIKHLFLLEEFIF